MIYMPIPIKQEQRSFKATAVNPVNASVSTDFKDIKEDSVKLNNAIANFGLTLKNNADKAKAEDIFNEYYDSIASSNSEFKRTQGKNTIDGVDGLNKYQSKALNDAQNKLSSLPEGIQREILSKISSLNIQSRESNNMHLFRETQKYEVEVFERTQHNNFKMLSDDITNAIEADPNFIKEFTKSGSELQTQFKDRLYSIFQDGMDFYISHGMDAETAKIKASDDVNKTILNIANSMSNQVDRAGFDPYADVHSFLEYSKQFMDYESWYKAITDIEKERLALAFDKDPESFRKNGKFNDEKAAELAPFMHTEPRRQYLRQVAAGNAANGGAGGAEVVEANNLYLRNLREKFTDIGMQALFDEILPEYALKTDIADKKSQEKRFDKMFRDNPSKLFDLMTELYNYNRGVISYNAQIQSAVIPSGDTESKQLEKSGYVTLSLKGQNTPETNRKLDNLLANFTGAMKTRAEDDKFFAFMNNMFSRETATFNDILSSALFNANGAANGKEGFFRRIERKFDFFGLMDLKREGINGTTLMTSTLAGMDAAYKEIDAINKQIEAHNSADVNKVDQWQLIDINEIGSKNFDDLISNLDEQCERQGIQDRNQFYSSRILGAYFRGSSAALGSSLKKIKIDTLTNSPEKNVVDMLSPEYNWNQVGSDFSTAYENEKKRQQESYLYQQAITSQGNAFNDTVPNETVAKNIANLKMKEIETNKKRIKLQEKADRTGEQQILEYTSVITKKKVREVIVPSTKNKEGIIIKPNGEEFSAEEYNPIYDIVEEKNRIREDIAKYGAVLTRGNE